MARFKVVYIDGKPGDGVIERPVLEARDAELVLGGCTTDDEVVAVAHDAPAILNGMYWMDRSLFERLPNLKVVVRGGVGFDNIDIDAATDAGVVVCNVIDYGSHEVANHAFAMLLALNRKIVTLDRAAREGLRKPPPQMMPHTGRFAGETLGLVSFGTIARAVARRAHGFDMRVIAFDPFVEPAAAEALGVELLPLDDVMSQSDYLSVHTPLSERTRGLIGASQLALMKPSAYIVLTSRGGVIDEEALADALREERVAGAGIDVWVQEPTDPAHPLLAFDNVIASSHFAWYSEVSVVALRRAFAEAAADVLHGIMPHSVVNPAILERVSLAPRPG
jgi:D-3-phosphoglycerate dehydrogenase / 2-oxoglutarate reductase